MAPNPVVDRIDFLSPLSVIPKFGPRRIAALNTAGIENLGQLLHYFPRRYLDRSTIVPINQLSGLIGQSVTVRGTITRTRLERGKKARLRIQLTDQTGTMEALWFSGIPYLRASLQAGKECLMSAKVGYYDGPQMVHPLVEFISSNPDKLPLSHVPVYRITLPMKEAGIGQRLLIDALDWTLRHMRHYPRVLPPWCEKEFNPQPLDKSLAQLHFPENPTALEPFRERITLERLYTITLMLRHNRGSLAHPGRSHHGTKLLDIFRSALPFTFTTGQNQALGALLQDAASPLRMRRVLQGDVGSGKTVVACAAALPCLESGFQVAWLVPTEILAYQTWQVLKQWLEPLGITVLMLSSSTAPELRRTFLAQLKSGKPLVAVGTHALLGAQVSFGRLGMSIVDEQHRFGVGQRSRLLDMDPAADFLLMSATPIPHTLAATLYGDLELVTIDGLPKGRLPVATHLVPEHKRADMEKFLREQVIDKGCGVYYVVPRIEQGDDEDLEIADIQTTFKRLCSGPLSGIPAALIHGRQSAQAKQETIDSFRSGRIKVLVATTVIEVGIDSPDATVMVIENAERFGLSQLHQLRGRVGRSDRQSYCFLLCAQTKNEVTFQRIGVFCSTPNGFTLAETDLKMRGPGNTKLLNQSGWDDPELPFILDNLETFNRIRQTMERATPR